MGPESSASASPPPLLQVTRCFYDRHRSLPVLVRLMAFLLSVLFNKVRLALCKEREEAQRNNAFKYISPNCANESLPVRGISSASRQTSRNVSRRKPQSASRCDDDDKVR